MLVFAPFLLCSHLVSAQSHGVYSGFLKRSGQKIVDGNGKDVLLRGMGLGGWMLQEGYMMHSAGFAATQYKLKHKIAELVGEKSMQEFYDAWLNNHCTHSDIDSLAKWGFNSVRLPFHYNLFTLPIEQEPDSLKNTWLPKGFQMVDSLLKWCKNNKMYLILDLHAAPGGQGNDLAISDRDNTKPSLWDSPANRSKTVALWVKLAERYANEPWIGGYDLLNEANWKMENNEPLRQLYLDLTASIRKVDQNHILFIEGNWFANDFKNLTPAWDDNMAYSFHKYWNSNETGAFQWVLDLREKNNVPVWLGESGENANQWFADCIEQMEKHNIGWSWWPLKKIGSVVDPATIKLTSGYQSLLDYWTGKTSAKPSPEVVKPILMDLAEKTKIENCKINYDLIDAMFRQVGTNETKAYTSLHIPGRIFAMDFDMGKNGYAYHDADYQNISTKPNSAWNKGHIERNDGVDLQADADSAAYSKGIHVFEIEAGEWMKYTVNVAKSGTYSISLRVANGSVKPGQLHFEVGGKPVSARIDIAPTGSSTTWKNVLLRNVKLKAGRQSLILKVDQGGFNLGSFTFTKY